MKNPAAIRRSGGAALVAALLLAAGAAAPVLAQSERPAITVIGGVAEYDLSGVGTTAFGALRLEVPLGTRLVLEPGVHYFAYKSQFRTRFRYIIPEIQLQLQPFRGRVRPYLGAGVGAARVMGTGIDGTTEASLAGALGLRIDAGGGWGLVGEGRVRALDPWTSSVGELGIGISRRL